MIPEDLGVSVTLAVLGVLALTHVATALVRRPQRGLLLLAALLPFDGLLQIVPSGESFGSWKEALLVVTFLAAVVAPRSARAAGPVEMPVWVPAMIAFVALGVVSAVTTGGLIAFWGLKVSYFYAVVPLILWRCPFTARDRDHLVTVLMGTGAACAVFGLLQQVLGPTRLNELGFEYNTAIRFSGSLLRSFSTFTQPFSFGLFMSLVLLVCLPVAMSDLKRTRNRVFLLTTPLLVVGMAASVVRGATLALLVGLVVLMVWSYRSLFHAMVPAALAVLFVPASILTDYFSSSSLNERASGWQTIFDSLLTAPLGNGIGTTGSAAEKSLGLGADINDLVVFQGTDELYLPDNQYVKTVIELGPLGLWFLLLLGAGVIAATLQAARRTTGSDRALAQGIAASTIGAAAASLVSTYLEIFPLDFYFWLLVGVLLSLGTSVAPDEGDRSEDVEGDGDEGGDGLPATDALPVWVPAARRPDGGAAVLTRLRARRDDRKPPSGADPEPPQETGLLGNTTALIVSRLLIAALGWGGTVLIARELSVEGFGRFTIIFSMLGLMSVVTDMGIGRIALRGMLGSADDDPNAFAAAYIGLRTVMGLVGYALVMLLMVVLGYPGEVVRATAVAAIVIVVATPSSALDVVFQSRMSMSAVSVAGVTGQVAQLALTAAIATAGGTVLLFTIPAVVAELVILAYKIPRANRLLKIRVRVDVPLWLGMLKEAVPLTIGFGLATIYYRVDAVMLSRLDTFDAVGVYGVSYKFIDIVHFAATAVTIPLLTLLVRAWPDDLDEFRQVMRRGAMLLGLIGGLSVVGLVGFAAPLTTALYGADYAVGEQATQILIVSQFLTLFGLLGLTALVAMARHRTYPVVMLVGLVLNIAANAVLIPRYSYEGAAVATLAVEVVVLCLMWAVVRRERSLWPLHLGRLVVVPAAIGVGLLVGWAADAVLPWVPAAMLASVAFVAVCHVGGVVKAAGIDLPRRQEQPA